MKQFFLALLVSGAGASLLHNEVEVQAHFLGLKTQKQHDTQIPFIGGAPGAAPSAAPAAAPGAAPGAVLGHGWPEAPVNWPLSPPKETPGHIHRKVRKAVSQITDGDGSLIGDAFSTGASAVSSSLDMAKMTGKKVFTFSRYCVGYVVLGAGIYMWAVWIPGLIMYEKERFDNEKVNGRSFEQYLTYNFNYWMTTGGLSSMGTLLGIGVLTLLTAGSLAYGALAGRSPIEGLWLCICWASAASVEPNVSAKVGLVGIASTIGGLVLLAVLLTTISDFFAERVRISKEGKDVVCEGRHIVLLGLSSQTKRFLEEVAICEANGAPKTVAILANIPKTEMEENIIRDNTNIGDLKLVCRQGHSSSKEDLWRIGADTASRVVILDDPSLPVNEADAVTMGTLLTLRGQGEAGWPINGHVSVQAAMAKNVPFMQKLYPGRSFILSGERLGRLMVQSSQDQGLCSIFNQLIGFQGDEFYLGDPTTLGVTGQTFGEMPFWFPGTIPVGLIDAKGNYLINPEKSLKITKDDKIIVLAEDDDALQPVQRPFFDFPTWFQRNGPGTFLEEDPNDNAVVKTCIIGFHERGYGCAILFALDAMCAPGSEVDIYTSLSEEATRELIEDSLVQHDCKFTNLRVVKIYSVPQSSATAAHRLKVMRLDEYDSLFVLANQDLGHSKADELSVATVIQIKTLLELQAPGKEFSPMVEICTPTADEQLKLCGVSNTINTTSMMSRAIAMVAIDTLAHGVLKDLLSADGNNLDLKCLGDYMGGKLCPEELSFAEATAFVNRGAQQVLIGWSEGEEGSKQWVLNPKDKLAKRKWTASDKLVVIKDV